MALKHRIGQLWEKELKDLTRAIEAYREALILDPMHDPTIAALSGLLHREGEPVLAAQVLEPIYADAGEFEKLIDVYEVMTAHADDSARRVELLHRSPSSTRPSSSTTTPPSRRSARALRADPANELTLGNLERLADATRAWESLARLYDAELQKILDVPRQVDLLLRLARVYEEELAKPDKAIETYRRVLDAEADNATAIAALDRLFEQGQRWPELAEILRKEIRLAQSDEEILAIEFRLGQVYEINDQGPAGGDRRLPRDPRRRTRRTGRRWARSSSCSSTAATSSRSAPSSSRSTATPASGRSCTASTRSSSPS